MADYDNQVLHASIKATEMTGRVLLALMKGTVKLASKGLSPDQGKMKLKKLSASGRKLSNLPIDKKDVRNVKKEMSRYKVDFSLKYDVVKDSYMLFFKEQDIDRVNLAMENCVLKSANKKENSPAKKEELTERDSLESMAVEKQHLGNIKKELKKENIEFSVHKTGNKDVRHITVKSKDFDRANEIADNCIEQSKNKQGLKDRFLSKITQIKNLMNAVKEQEHSFVSDKGEQKLEQDLSFTVDMYESGKENTLNTDKFQNVKTDRADLFVIKEQLKSQGVDLSIKKDAEQGVYHVFFKGANTQDINKALQSCLNQSAQKVNLKVKLKKADERAKKHNQAQQQEMKQERKQGRQKQRGKQH